MKKFFLFALTIALSLTAYPSYAIDSTVVKVEVDGRLLSLDVPPVIESNKTLVPLRAIFEALEIDLKWDGAQQRILATKEGTTIELIINRPYAIVNEKSIPLDVPAKIISDKTLVPVRFIAESTGSKVDWDASTRTVIVSSGNTKVEEITNKSVDNVSKVDEIADKNIDGVSKIDKISNPNLCDNITIYKDWIYFTYREQFFKMKKDDSNLHVISNHVGDDFIIVDDWIYFKDGTGGKGLHKMRLDGSEKTLIMEGWTIDINVAGDWVYWTDQKSKIVKVKLDGSESSVVLDNIPVTDISVVDDWIYYGTNDSKVFDTQFVIHKIKTDGTGNTRLSDRLSFHMSVYDNWIYYFNRSDNSIYKMDTDGENVTKIYEVNKDVGYMSVANDWIYYNHTIQQMDENGRMLPSTSLYKLKTDGTGHQLVHSGKMSISFTAIQDWIYYSYIDLYKVKNDGSKLEMYYSPN